ncbi:hypothetical protein JYT91_00815 [archaeon AH-315-M20]|nr:hypothetical protein [archaeon AH-315-M20]
MILPQTRREILQMGAAGLVFLAYSTSTLYPINAENRLQEVWAKAYHYERRFLWLKGLATLEIILGNEKYKSRLIVREEEDAFPSYSMSVEGRVIENRLCPTKFRIKKEKDDPDIITFKYDGGLLASIRVNQDYVNKADLEGRVIVDYLTAALQVMHNFRQGVENTQEISTISERGNISTTYLQIDGKSVLIPLEREKAIRALEVILDNTYEPVRIGLHIVWEIFKFRVNLDLVNSRDISSE